jgi:hypothetical protein
MNKSFFALALALSLIPTAAFAQSTNSAPPTADQKQAMHQAFRQFAQQEMQLHQQMRYQMLSALTPVHRRAVGALIGDLAIEPNPDPQAAAKRIDAMLTSNERARIVAAHQSFADQSRQLHQQMRTQMESMMPAAASNGMKSGHEGAWQPGQLDAGTLLLMGLAPHPMIGMMGHGGFGPEMHLEGAPPQ